MLKFGIIGLGNIGKRHAKHIDANDLCSLELGCDIDSTKNYESLEIVSEDEFFKADLDVINVCSPNYLHKEHVIKALKSGKHVVCEKHGSFIRNVERELCAFFGQ